MTAIFDPARAAEAKQFIEEVTGESFPSEDFQESLKDGVLLCKLLNKLEPGTVKKIQAGNMPFKQMENIEAYISGSRKLGVPDHYNFVTVDLFEGKNLGQVVQNIITLKRAKGFGFQKQNYSTAQPSGPSFSTDQSTSSQGYTVNREPTQLPGQDVKRVGPAMLSGRHENQAAFTCPICTKFVTSGAVNALGKAWHPNCFCCKKCGVKLAIAKYYEHNDQPYCDRCILIVRPQGSVRGATNEQLAKQKGFAFK